LILLFFVPVGIKAQDQKLAEGDSIQELIHLTFGDSIAIDSAGLAKDLTLLVPEKVFKPDPTKAIIYSAICPGLGQIYNRKYWKLPLVYGSFVGCAYAITWNGKQYSGYKKAYSDFIDKNSETNSWEDYKPYRYPEKLEDWSASNVNDFTNMLKRGKDYYRRYRDLSYIISVGIYAIWIIDAYVDAQLFDFDISPDLSMRLDPVIYERTSISSRSVGLQCSFTF
jgi:hypothetical protein